MVRMWESIWIPLIVAAIAVLWPWLLTLQRGWRFRRLIKRELEEVGPHPADPVADKPWWEHATKRFVHEETFRRVDVPENRDFILSLNPELVYQVSQLWIALEQRNGHQWREFLTKLSQSRVSSERFKEAASRWVKILDQQPEKWCGPMGVPTPFRREAALQRTGPLFEKRFEPYTKLLPQLDLGPPEAPRSLSVAERAVLAEELRRWFYESGSGLLLSGRASEQFGRFRSILTDPHATPEDVRHEASQLRTDLKIDLGVRQPQERLVESAWPEDERW